MRFETVAALALVVLSGRVLDRTTGQPLAHVRVTAATGQAATTAADGSFALRGLHGSSAALTLESADVPEQHLTVRLDARTTHRDLRACSTTLDYACGAPAPTDSGASGAG